MELTVPMVAPCTLMGMRRLTAPDSNGVTEAERAYRQKQMPAVSPVGLRATPINSATPKARLVSVSLTGEM